MRSVKVRVPATTANLGPGFDCLGLALDLWNEATFTFTGGPPSLAIGGESATVIIHGEGENSLPTNEENLIVRAAQLVFVKAEVEWPDGIRIECHNRIPLASGLGSSAAATLCGLLGANAFLDDMIYGEIMRLGIWLEGHMDNLAAASEGGLVLSNHKGREYIGQKVKTADWKVVVVVPEIRFSTKQARAVLPKEVPMEDAVFNIGRTALLVEALRNGDIELLRQTMVDRLHQQYRLPLIPGAEAAISAAYQAGGAAALSGAGPGVFVFVDAVRDKIMTKAFRSAFGRSGFKTRIYTLNTTKTGSAANTL